MTLTLTELKELVKAVESAEVVKEETERLGSEDHVVINICRGPTVGLIYKVIH